MKHTARKLGLIGIGMTATAIGFIGIVVPVLPGILFFAIAAVCFVGASDRLRRNLRSKRHFRPYFEQYEAAHGLSEWQRIKLAGWLSVSAITAYVRRR